MHAQVSTHSDTGWAPLRISRTLSVQHLLQLSALHSASRNSCLCLLNRGHRAPFGSPPCAAAWKLPFGIATKPSLGSPSLCPKGGCSYEPAKQLTSPSLRESLGCWRGKQMTHVHPVPRSSQCGGGDETKDLNN